MLSLKRIFHNIFLTVGLCATVFIPVLALTNGMKSTITTIVYLEIASVFFGLSNEILRIKFKYKRIIHILICLIITTVARLLFGYMETGEWLTGIPLLITIPVFAEVYLILSVFMKIFAIND